MFLNGEEIATPGPHGERIVDDSFLAAVQRHHETRTFTLPNRRFGARWELELSTPTRTLEPGAFTRRGAGQVELVRALAGPAAPRRLMAELRATYRLQLGPDLRFDDGAGARALPARPRRQPPVPVAVVRRARGLDARLRRRRPARASRTRSAASEGFRALAAAAREAGHGDRARHRPQPHGRPTTRTRSGPTSAARALLRHRPGDRPAPALLRHRPPRRRAPGGPGGVRRRRTSSRSRSCARGSSTGCGSTIRTGSPTRRSTCARLRDGGRRARVGGEDPRPRRAAARLAGRGHGRLRVPRRRRGAVRRPGGRGAR